MFFQIGKSPAFALILGVLLIFSQNVRAQDKNSEQNTDDQIQTKSSMTAAQVDSVKTNTADSLNADNRQNQPQTEKSVEQQSLTKNERFSNFTKAETVNAPDRFRANADRERESKLKSLLKDDGKPKDDTDNLPLEEGFQWRSAIRQSLLFLAVQHGYAFTQPKTREALKGKFFKDYAKSVKSLQGWDDGGRFFTNYIAHPMQGAFTGFIYVQNDPKAKRQQFGMSKDYWKSRLKAFAWTTAWSTQFEIGPISQASIGNVGLKGKQTWEDVVVTPTLGTVMLVAEDALDRYVMQRIERQTDNFYIRIFARMLLSPTRVFANLIRFKTPWHRDRPMAK